MDKEHYVIVKKFNDGHEDANFCTFDFNTAFMMWSDVIEQCDRLYYDFELRKYNAGYFETIKKCDKTLDKVKTLC